MSAIWLRLAPYMAIAIASLALGYGIAETRWKARYAAREADFAHYRELQARALTDAHAEALARRQERDRLNQEISTHVAAKDAEIARLAATVRARTAGVRLCRQASSADSGVPAGADRGAGGDPASRAGAVVSAEASGHLIELAADADRIVSQLEACQVFARSLQLSTSRP